MAKLKKGSTIDDKLIAVCNNDIQKGLNAEMVGDKAVNELSPKDHHHDEAYYTQTDLNKKLSKKS